MPSFNRVILMGNLTRDPQLKYLPSNTAVCEFGLAVNRTYKDRDGNQKEEVSFVDLSAFGRIGEVINQYMSKGRPILVEGWLKYHAWTGQDGQKRSRLTVVVENFTFVGSRGDQPTQEDAGGGAPASSNWQSAGGGQPPTDYGPPPTQAPPSQAPPAQAPPTGENIPF